MSSFNWRTFDISKSWGHAVTFVAVLLSLGLFANIIGMLITSAQMNDRIAAAEQVNQKLLAENAALATSVAVSESPAYVEQIAREQLGYSREGDVVLQAVLPPPTPVPTPVAPTDSAPPRAPNWQGWWRALWPDTP